MLSNLEKILTNSYKAGMISYINEHPEEFESAIDLAVSNKQPYSWRAAWLLWSCMDANDSRLDNYISKIIEIIPQRNDGHQKDLLKILYMLDLPDDLEGKVFDLSISLWEQLNKIPSVRYNAIKLLFKILKKHPELFPEIEFFLQEHYFHTLSPGVKRGVYKMVKQTFGNCLNH
jgi:hypothetical protein